MSSSIIKKGQSAVKSVGGTNFSPLLKAVKSKLFDQLCLLVLDGSGSMSWEFENGNSKAKVTEEAVLHLIAKLKSSSKSSGFHLGIITYSKIPEVRLQNQLIDNIQPSEINLGKKFGEGPATRIDLALQRAYEVATEFINNKPQGSRLERTVRILLMSDGYCDMPTNTTIVANNIKDNHGETVRICCCLLADQNEEFFLEAEELMKSIASKSNDGRIFFTNSNRGSDLRGFFERSSTEE
jgi:uncharacterized protein YegL